MAMSLHGIQYTVLYIPKMPLTTDGAPLGSLQSMRLTERNKCKTIVHDPYMDTVTKT